MHIEHRGILRMRGQRRPDGSVSARRAISLSPQIGNQNRESRAWSDWQAESFSIRRFLWTTSGHQPFVPEHLSDDARGCIDIIKQSMPSNVYSALDSFLLSAFAMAWATHKRAAHEIGAPDFQWTTASKRGSPQASPWIRIANQQAGIMAALGDRLGLDPKSRTALKLPDAKQRKSKFAGLMGARSSSTYKN